VGNKLLESTMVVRSHSWRRQSIRLVAARNGLGENTLRRMCDASEVETVIYNGVKYIPPRAEQRLRDDLGLAEQPAHPQIQAAASKSTEADAA
jgi:hypothetical protein